MRSVKLTEVIISKKFNIEQVRQGKFKVIFGRNPLAASVLCICRAPPKFQCSQFFPELRLCPRKLSTRTVGNVAFSAHPVVWEWLHQHRLRFRVPLHHHRQVELGRIFLRKFSGPS